MTPSGGQNLGDLSMEELFRMEVESQSTILNDGLLTLEKNPEERSGLEALMRAAHSVKGAARIVELDAAVSLAHAMEDCFVAAQEGKISFDEDAIDTLLRGVDMLTAMSEADDIKAWLEAHTSEIDELVANLSAVMRGEKRAPLEATPAEPENAPPEEGRAETQKAPDEPTGAVADMSMLELFNQEVEAQTVILNEGLLALEKHPGAEAPLESLMRAAHSIKGAARIVNLDAAVTLAHAMEDCFVAAQAKTISLKPDDIDTLLQGVDTLSGLAEAPEAESWLAGHAAELGETVEAILSIRHGGAPPKKQEKPVPVQDGKAPPEKAGRSGAEAQHAADRVVRVTAANLDRLMGLTGECLVEAGWLQPFTKSLLRLKGTQSKVARELERLQESLEEKAAAATGDVHLSEAKRRIGECRDALSTCLNDFELFSRRLQNLTERLYREVISSRMRPFADGVRAFPRTVRDVARQLGKNARLEIIGETTEVDRDILEKLEAPLTHLVRNAVDHGIESPAERQAAGKPAEGTIRLEAMHRAGTLCVSVSDDGRGIELEPLRADIVRKNLATEDMAANLTENELMEFLFLPGFSTAGKVTELSGRGVGLDVVQSMVQEVGGSVRASSRAGEGMTFHLQLPITLSVLRTLLVQIGGEPYAFPLVRIDRVLMLATADVELVEDRQYFKLDDENIGLVSARQLFTAEPQDGFVGDLPVLVISDRLNRYGLVVDRFLGERDLVVRALDPRLGKVKDVSAAALMEDGSPLLIVDVDDMVRSIDNLLSGGRLRKVGRGAEDKVEAGRKRILVVDDSITVREVQRKLLENRGYEADVAVDGMDGWNALRAGQYDLVISDVDMPRMNGIELVTRIKQDQKLKSLPVMIVSYKDREEDRQLGLQAGADYYLTKTSFHDESLLNAVADLIGEPLR